MTRETTTLVPTDKLREMQAELAELRAFKQACEGQEAAVTVRKEPDYWSGGHFHEGSKPYIYFADIASLPIGTKLYSHPDPEAAQLRQHLKLYEAECSGLREAGFENAQDLFTSYEGLRQQVATLTEQRDMAVEALEHINSGEKPCGAISTLNYCIDIADEVLIKIREVMK